MAAISKYFIKYSKRVEEIDEVAIVKLLKEAVRVDALHKVKKKFFILINHENLRSLLLKKGTLIIKIFMISADKLWLVVAPTKAVKFVESL